MEYKETGKNYKIMGVNIPVVKDITVLNKENAKTAKIVKNISHPEWGTKRFNYNEQPLNDGKACSTVGSGCDSGVLFEGEYKFWEVIK